MEILFQIAITFSPQSDLKIVILQTRKQICDVRFFYVTHCSGAKEAHFWELMKASK